MIGFINCSNVLNNQLIFVKNSIFETFCKEILQNFRFSHGLYFNIH